MTMIAVAWLAFGLGTTLGFLLARSVENGPEMSDETGALEPAPSHTRN